MLGEAVYALGDWRGLHELIADHNGRAIVLGVPASIETEGAAVEVFPDLASVLNRNPRLVLYLDPGDDWFNADAVAAECRRDTLLGPVMMFCVPFLSAPVDHCRMDDGTLSSFVCTPDILVNAASRLAALGGGTLCYHAVSAALDQKPAAQFRVLGQAANRQAPPSCSTEGVALVIPHRGELRRLEACLNATMAACPKAKVLVGFDEEVVSRHMELVDAFPNVAFFSVSPLRVGPYVIRQFLVEYSDASFIAFQDSDDLSCAGRLEAQIVAALATEADIIGCHEIRVEECAKVVQALRFPLDVNAALANISAHCQLSPTTLVRRQTLLSLNGFSTRRRYASDREFLLRASLTHRIANCDDFLYVRFRHPRSLTMSPETGQGNRYRERFTEIWERDAVAVRDGRISLETSSLRPRHLRGKTYLFTDVRTGHTHDFRPGERPHRVANESPPTGPDKLKSAPRRNSMANATEPWSDRWPDELWLKRFRNRCLHDIENGSRIDFPVSWSDKRLVPAAIPRRIWMYWAQGWRDAPALALACRTSWIQENPAWQIISLDNQTENEYADIADLVGGKRLSPAARSDLVRLSVLASHGGVWVDATTYCSIPLSRWLPQLLQSGFFAFARPGHDRLLASWFLASEPGGHLIERWLRLARRYWRLVTEADHYYWLHYLFAECLRTDVRSRLLWARTPQVSADASREVMRRAAETVGIDDILALVAESRVAVHKLDWRMGVPAGSQRTPLAALLASPARQGNISGETARAPIPAAMLRPQMQKFVERHSAQERQDLAARARQIQVERDSLQAIGYLLNTIGLEMSVDRDESYCAEALDFHLGLLQACSGQPEVMSEHIKKSRTMPGPDDLLLFSDHVTKSLVTRQHWHKGIARGMPAIFFIGMPRSASASLAHSLAKLLDIPVVRVCMGLFPDYYLVPSWLDMFFEGGAITQDHFMLNDFNLGVLKSRGQRHVFVSIRDPRASARSYVHWLSHEHRAADLFVEDSIRRECLGNSIPWLQNWLEHAQDDTLPFKIHLLKFQDIVGDLAGTVRYITRVLQDAYPAVAPFSEYYQVDEVRVHFNQGDDDAWRSEVSEETREILWNSCTPEIRRFLRLKP